MSDLQKLRESILAKAHQEGQAQLEKTKKIHEIEYQEQLQRLMREKEQERQHLLDKEAQRLTRLEQQMANQERQGNLNSRQALIDELFTGAVEQMKQWSSEQLLGFIQQILAQFSDKAMTVIFGSQTREKLSSDDLQALQAQYANLTFVDEVIKGAGIILRDQRVDYNFMFEQIVSSIKADMSTHLAQQVFEQSE